jgi:hypothetical protein
MIESREVNFARPLAPCHFAVKIRNHNNRWWFFFGCILRGIEIIGSEEYFPHAYKED